MIHSSFPTEALNWLISAWVSSCWEQLSSELQPLLLGTGPSRMAQKWQSVLLSQPKKLDGSLPKAGGQASLFWPTEEEREQQEVTEWNDDIQNEVDRLNKHASKKNSKVEEIQTPCQPFCSRKGQNQFPTSHTLGNNVCQAFCLGRKTKTLCTIWPDSSNRIWRYKTGLQKRFFFRWKPYFENEVLSKGFHLNESGEQSSKATGIKQSWKACDKPRKSCRIRPSRNSLSY